MSISEQVKTNLEHGKKLVKENLEHVRENLEHGKELVKENLEYGKELVESGLEGASEARRAVLAAEETANILSVAAEKSWQAASFGVLVGAVVGALVDDRKPVRGVIAGGIHVAEYLTELPPKEVLRQKLHAAIELSRKRLAPRDAK